MKHFFNLSSCSLAILSFLFLCMLPVRAETITYSTIGGTWQQVNDTTWSMDKDGDGEVDVTLVKNGDEWKYYFTVADPDAEYYGWEEDPINGYEIEGKGSRTDPVIFTKDGIITNKLETVDPPPIGSLILKKEVAEGDKTKNFRFTITLSSDNPDIQGLLKGTTVFGDVTFQDGIGSAYLADGESVTISGLMEGISYRIEETADEGYTASWTGPDNGTIAADASIEVVCTNTKKTTEPVVPEEPASLSVSKTVVDPYQQDTFSFRVVFWGLEAGKGYQADIGVAFTADSSGMADVAFTLEDAGCITFQGLPDGCQYQVMEEANAYTPSYWIINGGETVQQGGNNPLPGQDLATEKETLAAGVNAEVAFTNTGEKTAEEPETTEVKVKKIWDDNENESGMRPEYITVYLMQDGEDAASARLSEGSRWEFLFQDLPKYKEDGSEYAYQVREVNVPGYETQVRQDAAGEEGLSFTITNTQVETGNLKISKTVAGDGADTGKEFRFHLHLEKDGSPVSGTYSLDGTEGTKAGTIILDEQGNASFTLKNGEAIVLKGLPSDASYTITEEAYKNYEPSGTGTFQGNILPGMISEENVVNTYTPPETKSLSIRKTVAGNMGSKVKQFQFSLYLEDMAYPETVHYKKGDDEGDLAVDKGGSVRFTLADTEEILISGITAGTKYHVTEEDAAGYTVTSEGAYGFLTEDRMASFVNTRNLSVPTGAVPGCMAGIFFIGGAGIIFLAWKRKKNI